MELDIAGADIVTDFGVICLLFEDPEQIFTECWDREKTVGSHRKCQRAFPHPHFDKPIPDPSETSPPQSLPVAGHHHHHRSSPLQFLYLRKTFYEVIKNPLYELNRLPICQSLRKLRLENTRVKGDGASVIIECCPNVYSLGYLVFASAGLKQVFGYDERFSTKFTEIFYRGPSDQKLQTIGNCCPQLNTMFLGSNSLRRLHAGVFCNWKRLEYLTLENIVVDDVNACFNVIGHQLKGLKIQCRGIDLGDIALQCQNLIYLIIQNENPVVSNTKLREISSDSIKTCYFPRLKELEISCSGFSKHCLGF
ncbi:uncharacterized protein [Lepeophtheirus salmonis]|uniref:uncharacterized protein n=1 Tax=Lepeophtheirus salmonis TaxID=72036 RepID=UPI001AE865FE|nr:uncharacterized protein LOC121131650 [Lepeophtheirus salmonis]